ncbi:3-deoxy-7-phosphoheptulonate synthase [Trinickia soli]|uniref:Phospho-2-dehydro-3-deoxyheptonate aldolase n=1 Tax=Trinickia soli TaxID=380675 RepID=A0A2N7W9Q0_9BURK|nr:3-deoxy-7-phosphoheptulonate synthase [Trinickia soli]PMS26136.1 3-deoxy-7-phosphoheptulonate synthase [Trinickia soli]CAB3679994.1 Phospho-2-dehydro-3-deoxyheptonate aldolase, Phe-sensitive [Trinickia soli]
MASVITHLSPIHRGRLITAAQLRALLPPSGSALGLVLETRQALSRIVAREDARLALIVGPCSVHDARAALDYARRLAPLRDAYRDALEIVMRVYLEKPRTTLGWKGLINDPNLDGSSRIDEGLRRARQLLIDIHALGVPAATEFLDLMTVRYVDDLISWAAIGARTTESPMHRQAASGLALPIGFKNGTDGNVKVAIDALSVARAPHHYLTVSMDGRIEAASSRGNPAAHVVLRGGRKPNYDRASVDAVCDALERARLVPSVVIDASHGNSGKVARAQVDVCTDIAARIADGETRIAGVMVESNLAPGRQDIVSGTPLAYGQSVTDECLGWNDTVELIRLLARAVRTQRRTALFRGAQASRALSDDQGGSLERTH